MIQNLADSVEESIRNHVMHNYYLICFSTVNQIDDIEMWKEYAEGTGYCVVYRDEDIQRAVNTYMLDSRDADAIFREVDCGEGKTDITSFLDVLLEKLKGRYDDEAAIIYACKHWADYISREQGHTLIMSMFHKIGSFPEKQEKRVVIRNPAYRTTYVSRILTVKPKAVICSSLMPKKDIETIRESAHRNGIDFSIHQL